MSDEMIYSIPPVILELLDLPHTKEVMKNHLGEQNLIQFRHMPELAEGEWVDFVSEVLKKGFTCTWDETGQFVKKFHFCLPDFQSSLVVNGRPEVADAVRTIEHLGAGVYSVTTTYERDDHKAVCVKLFTNNGRRLERQTWHYDDELKYELCQTFDECGNIVEVKHTPTLFPHENIKVESKSGRTEKLRICRADAEETIFIRDRFHIGDLDYRHQVREDGEYPKSFVSVGGERVLASMAGDLKEIVLRDDKGRRIGYHMVGGSSIVVDRICTDDATYMTALTFPINGLPDFNSLENSRKTLLFSWKPDDEVGE